MQILMKPVDMIAHFFENGLPIPMRMRTTDLEGEQVVIPIDKVLYKSLENVGKEKFVLYKCQCVVNGLSRVIELKFDCGSCVWYIYKF